jgi:hypothetical protein
MCVLSRVRTLTMLEQTRHRHHLVCVMCLRVGLHVLCSKTPPGVKLFAQIKPRIKE